MNGKDEHSYIEPLILCGYLGDEGRGKRVHADIVENGMAANTQIQSALISMFGKCGDIESAQSVWNGIDDDDRKCNLFLYGSMMNALINSTMNIQALRLYDEIRGHLHGMHGVNTIHLLALKACGNLKDLDKGHSIFCDDINVKSKSKEWTKLQSAMILFLSKCNEEYTEHINMESAKMALTTMSKDGQRDNALFKELMFAFKEKYFSSFSAKEWLLVIDCYGLLEDTASMMMELKKMMRSNPNCLNQHILVCSLQHLLRHQETQYVAVIWSHCLKDNLIKNMNLNSLCLQSLVLCVHRSRHCHHDRLLMDIWSLIVKEKGITPNLHCLCLAIYSFSKYKDTENKGMAFKLLDALDINDLSTMSLDKTAFIHILKSFGNLNCFHRMSSFYAHYVERWNHGQHDVAALIVLGSYPQTLWYLQTVLLSESLDLSRVSRDHLVSLHRIAIDMDMGSIQKEIEVLLKNKVSVRNNVVSTIWLNHKQYVISTNSSKQQCPFGSDEKVEALTEEINHSIETSLCRLPSEREKTKHLKSHSEKRALAILLKLSRAKTVKIKVESKMCSDCHSFFENASRVYKEHIIECVDPCGIHLFRRGVCALCS